VVTAGLPDSMDVASADRETAVADASLKGTVISAVAYASATPPSGGLAALQNAVTTESPQPATPDAASVPAAELRTGQGDGVPSAGVVASAATATPAPAVLSAASTPAVVAAPAVAKPVVLASLDTTAPKEPVAARSPELDALIARYAQVYQVPLELVRRVVKRESTFNPAARNGPYWGLMQIRHDTAKGMGYRGTASGLLDAETNLTYAVKYLRGAFITAKGDHDQAVKYYSRGYYYDAKKRGLLEEAGLRPGKAAASVQVASADAAAKKHAELDRGSRLVVQSLPGVAQTAGAPTLSLTD
jgi:soluble lytic murein transglycosylase-like protein